MDMWVFGHSAATLRRRSSASMVYRGELTSVPRGGIEDGETSGQAAVREAWEEGGFSSEVIYSAQD